MSFSRFGSCFACLKKILHLEKLHFLLYFSFKAQFEVHQNDPEEVFEGDIFAQTTAEVYHLNKIPHLYGSNSNNQYDVNKILNQKLNKSLHVCHSNMAILSWQNLNQMALIHKHKKVQLQIKYLLQNKIS